MVGSVRHGLVFAVSLCFCCSPHKPAPETARGPGQPPKSGAPVSPSLSRAPLADAEAKQKTQHFTNAEPPQFATVLRDAVVLQIGLQGTRVSGAVELLNVPDDSDSSYLARRSVSEAALPEIVRQKRGIEVTLLKPAWSTSAPPREELTPCNARLGAVAAYGWANDAQPWASLGNGAIARNTFERGTHYLAAELEGGACPLRRWAMFSAAAEVRFWQVAPVSEQVVAAAVQSLRDSPYSAARQAEYTAFVSTVGRVRAQVEAERANDAKARERLAWYQPRSLASSWLALSGRTVVWKVENELDPALLVGLFERHVAEIVPDDARAGSGQQTLLFEATLVVIWKYDGGIESVVSALVSRSSEEFSGFELQGAVSSPGGLPALLFNAFYVNGVLRPVDGKYAVDESLMLRPSEPRSAPGKTGG